jgi:hypothetical protein
LKRIFLESCTPYRFYSTNREEIKQEAGMERVRLQIPQWYLPIVPVLLRILFLLWTSCAIFIAIVYASDSPPGKATLIYPTGPIAVKNPMFTWLPVADATRYFLWVDDSSGAGAFQHWFSAYEIGCVPGAGACSFTVGLLPGGNASWKVQTGNDYGDGPWSDPLTFTVPEVLPPNQTWMNTPNGIHNFTKPTYSWNYRDSATGYYLWVDDSRGSGVIRARYTPEQVGCGPGVSVICKAKPGTPIVGDAVARIQPYNSGGAAPWSSPVSFTVAPGFQMNDPFDEPFFNWQTTDCTWSVNNGFLQLTNPNEVSGFSDIFYRATLKNVDFRVRLVRSGCSSCANYIILQYAKGYGWTDPTFAYYFQYTADGYFSVWMTYDSVDYEISPWTQSPAINQGNSINDLRLVAIESNFQFYINGTLVWSGSDPWMTETRVGVGMYFSQYDDKFQADWATLNTPPDATVAGFDDDGKTDIAVYRPETGTWFVKPSLDPSVFGESQWGVSTDIPTAADYDADGRIDIAVWRPESGIWYILPTSFPGYYSAIPWGMAGDIPVAADYDGDYLTDFAVWRPDSGNWYIRPSSSPNTYSDTQWGLPTDIPLPGDYDGDGRADVAVWRRDTAIWYVLPSQSPGTYTCTQWGLGTDIPVPIDYDGDGNTDLAVWRPESGIWYVLSSQSSGTYTSTQWGIQADAPVPGDYDGDLKADIAIWRPSNRIWYILLSGTPGTYTAILWGLTSDVPVSPLTNIMRQFYGSGAITQ